MTLTKAIPIRNAGTTPLDGRLADMAQHVCNNDGSPRVGVLDAAPTIVTALATMNVAVAAAEFVTSKGKADGVAVFTNDGTVNVPIPAAPASNSRIDVICVRHNDNTTGDGTSVPAFVVRSGAAAASPVKPALTTGDLELATLRVYAGTTAANGGANVLTNTYGMTAARGGTVPFRTKLELDAWTTAENGQRAIVLADGRSYTRFGGAWGIELSARHGGNPGSGISGQAYPQGTVDLPGGLLIQTGWLVSGTSVAFGNEYFPVITFPFTFPNAILSIQGTLLSGSPVTKSTGSLNLDASNASTCRFVVSESPNPWVRALSWVAFGY